MWLISSSQSLLTNRNGSAELGPEPSPGQSDYLHPTERHRYVIGWEGMGLTDPVCLQIKHEAGRERKEKGENENSLWNFQAVLFCMKRVGKRQHFLLFDPVTEKISPNPFWSIWIHWIHRNIAVSTVWWRQRARSNSWRLFNQEKDSTFHFLAFAGLCQMHMWCSSASK